MAEVVETAADERAVGEGKVMSGGTRSASSFSAKAAAARVRQAAAKIELRRRMGPIRKIAFVLQGVTLSIVILSKNPSKNSTLLPTGK